MASGSLNKRSISASRAPTSGKKQTLVKTFYFYVENSSKESYECLIKEIHECLIKEIHDFLSETSRLVAAADGYPGKTLLIEEVANDIQFFEIEFIGDGKQNSCCCRFLMHNLYFFAFRNHLGVWYYLSDWSQTDEMAGMLPLPGCLTVHYIDLEKGDINRKSIKIGTNSVRKCVCDLSNYNGEKCIEGIRTGLLTMTQIISESLRFLDLYLYIHGIYDFDRRLEGHLVDLEKDFKKYSWSHTQRIFLLGGVEADVVRNVGTVNISLLLRITGVEYVPAVNGVKTEFNVVDNDINIIRLGLERIPDL